VGDNGLQACSSESRQRAKDCPGGPLRRRYHTCIAIPLPYEWHSAP